MRSGKVYRGFAAFHARSNHPQPTTHPEGHHPPPIFPFFLPPPTMRAPSRFSAHFRHLAKVCFFSEPPIPPPFHFLGYRLMPQPVSFPPAMPISFWGLLASFHIQFTAISKLNIYAIFRPFPSLSLFMGHKMSSTGNWYFWRFLAQIIVAYIKSGWTVKSC